MSLNGGSRMCSAKGVSLHFPSIGRDRRMKLDVGCNRLMLQGRNRSSTKSMALFSNKSPGCVTRTCGRHFDHGTVRLVSDLPTDHFLVAATGISALFIVSAASFKWPRFWPWPPTTPPVAIRVKVSLSNGNDPADSACACVSLLPGGRNFWTKKRAACRGSLLLSATNALVAIKLICILLNWKRCRVERKCSRMTRVP